MRPSRRFVPARFLVPVLALLAAALGTTAPVVAVDEAPCIVDGIFFDTCADSGVFFPDPGPGGGGVLAAPPDLTSLGGFLFLPQSLEAGDPYQAEVVIANLGGTGFADPLIQVDVYLSPAGDDTLLPVNLLASLEVSFPRVSSQFPDPSYVVLPFEGVLPGSIAPGQYRLAVDIDVANAMLELEEDNNEVVGGAVIAVGGDPDLQPVAGSLEPLGIVHQGATLDLRSRLRNVGEARIEGPVSIAVRYRAVADGGDDLGGVILGTQHLNLQAGQSLADETVAIPPLLVAATLPPGEYQIGVDVDFDGAVAERDETNNSALIGPLQVRAPAPTALPDLVIIGGTFAQEHDPLEFGGHISITLFIRNAGTTVTPGSSFDLKVYASSDATITSSDNHLEVLFGPHINAVVDIPPLAAGFTTNVHLDLVWPATLPAGTWYLGAIANPTPDFNELLMSNNKFTLGKVRTVSLCRRYATAADAVALWDLFFTGTGSVALSNGTVAHFDGEEYCDVHNTLASDTDYFGGFGPPPVDSCDFGLYYSMMSNYVTRFTLAFMHSACVVTFADIEAQPDESTQLVHDLEQQVDFFKGILRDAKKSCDGFARRNPFTANRRRYCSCPNSAYLDFVTSGPHPGDAACVYAF